VVGVVCTHAHTGFATPLPPPTLQQSVHAYEFEFVSGPLRVDAYTRAHVRKRTPSARGGVWVRPHLARPLLATHWGQVWVNEMEVEQAHSNQHVQIGSNKNVFRLPTPVSQVTQTKYTQSIQYFYAFIRLPYVAK
jgi:uncharacterized protein (DUF1684 family)